MMKKDVAPSLLAAKCSLYEATKMAKEAGAGYIHFDFMDGVFVPNKSFEVESFKEVARISNIIKDVHIMGINPDVYAKRFLDMGADIVTFHLEAVDDELLRKTATIIKNHIAIAGISIKPKTPVKELSKALDTGLFGLVLIMSVEPGKGGQSFIEESYARLREAKELIGDRGIILEVDGGINKSTGPRCIECGADLLVAGSYLYGHEDFKQRLEALLR